MQVGEEIWQSLTALRARRPLIPILCIPQAMDFTACVLLAAGAQPLLIGKAREVEAPSAAALCLSLGSAPEESLLQAATIAQGLDLPWVLDPAGLESLPQRAELAAQLLKANPAIVRGNGSAILALGGGGKAVGRDTASVEALDAAQRLAKRSGAIVAVTGAVDYVTDGTRLAAVTNGHHLMASLSSGGAALSALMAAFLASADDAFDAAMQALGYFGVAGELAARDANGPGTMRVQLLDRLHRLTRGDLLERLRAQ